MASPGSLLTLVQYTTTPSPPPSGFIEMYIMSNTVYIQDSLGNVYAFGSTTAITQLTGDVSATGPGSAVATVNFVDGQSAANVAASVVATQNATNLNTPSTLVLRDASGNFSASIITANLTGTATNATTAVNFTGSLSGDVTGTQSATTIASAVVTGKLLTGYAVGSNTPIAATDSILQAFEKVQGQINATTSGAITSLNGDVSATGPGAATATVNSVGGQAASAVASAAIAVAAATSTNTASTLVLRDASGNFSASIITANLTGSASNNVLKSGDTMTGSLVITAAGTGLNVSNNVLVGGTISASNFTGSSSGTNTGDVTLTSTNSIDLAFSAGQTGLSANLNLSAASPDVGYIPAVSAIKSDGLLVEVLAGVPVQIGTSNNIGSALSAARSDHVHAITSAVVLSLALTGYTTGTNTPINATDTFLQAFENLQAQISATVSGAITSLTGDVIASGPGAAASTVQKIQGSPISGTAPTDAQILVWVNATPAWTPVSVSGDATIADTGALTLSTVNSNVGSFGSSTAIPTIIVNGKGLITAVTTSAVVAPAGTLTGTTLASNVVTSSLTSVGTITSGVWSAGAITTPSITDSGLTSGSVVFAGTGGLLSQDNANFYWNEASFSLGLGTQPNAATIITGVNTTGVAKPVQLMNYGAGGSIGLRGDFARGTVVSPTAAQAGDALNFMSGRGYGASQFAVNSTGSLNIYAAETFTNTSNATYVTIQATPTGSVIKSEHLRVSGTGVTLGPPSGTGSTDFHTVNGAQIRTTKTVTANYTVDTTTTDDIILCNQTAAISIQLPSPTIGRTIVIKDRSGNAQTNPITLLQFSTETIEGLAVSKVLYTNYGSWTLHAGSAGNWWFI